MVQVGRRRGNRRRCERRSKSAARGGVARPVEKCSAQPCSGPGPENRGEAEILADFPELAIEDIRACLAFAAERERRLLGSVA